MFPSNVIPEEHLAAALTFLNLIYVFESVGLDLVI